VSLLIYGRFLSAETSVTVEDVTHVVDSGYVKEVRFDPASGISSLQDVFVSRVSARQRAGRCIV
jgi:HrpA-like RNA helicase